MHQADTLEKMMEQTHKPLGGFTPTPAAKPPRVMCVTSGKGGVGKTNIVVNLAYCLAKLGKRTVILDADLNLANVDILLGLTPRYNLHHVFLGEKTLQDILVKGPGGISILPASSGILELSDLTEEQKLYFLSEMAELGEQIDILLIDTAAGINKNVIYFTLAAQERIIVLTPEPTSLTDAYAMIKVLSSRHEVKKFRILVNSAHSEKEALAVFRQLSLVADRFLATLSLDYLGYIPFDKKLLQAVRAQRLVTELSPKSQVAGMFKKLADHLAEEEIVSQADGNIKFFWKGLFDL
ncbi:MAG: MinD/ParA family protein [Deltaproteobacteria bacterium]|nr:MinD/ParA family protein [Deltaproteobacteria bacterium]